MRAAVVLAMLLAAGCVSSPPSEPAANATVHDDASVPPAMNETPLVGGVGERMPATNEHFVMTSEHALAVIRAGDAKIPETKLPETVASTAFYQSFAQPLVLPEWSGPPSRVAWETTGDVDIAVSFTSDAAATSTNPKPAGFPGVGGWFGTTDRFAFFLLAMDAPDTLEAGKVYTVHLVAKPPQGGFFVLEGEQLALHTFLSYQTADGRPVSYVVGGPQPAGFTLPHEHFNLSAKRQTIVLEESGELPPNPAPTGDMMQDPPEFSISIPADAVYVIAEVTGASKTGTRADIDLGIRTAGGDAIVSGSSPAASEKVALGPGNLRAYGHELVARVTGAAIPAGGTFSLKVTAFSP